MDSYILICLFQHIERTNEEILPLSAVEWDGDGIRSLGFEMWDVGCGVWGSSHPLFKKGFRGW